MKRPTIIIFALSLLFFSSVVEAKDPPPVLELPLDCVPGESCWIANYVDNDAAPKSKRDYRCGVRTYDTHKGTDFAIRDLRAMHMGMPVLAAAPGVVAGTREGMEDISIRELKDHATIKGKECGNGVLIKHKGGWSTQYCHMKRDSVQVMKGQRVEAGQKIGQVGLSGKTEFPHLHVLLRKGKVVVDPFVGLGGGGKCGDQAQPLWDEAVLNGFSYGPAIYNVGFSASIPKTKAVRKGLFRGKSLDKRAPALILWSDIFGVMAGDKIVVKIFGPDGKIVLNHSNPNPKTFARRMVYAGKKKKRPFWPVGTYTGTITLTRTSQDGAEQSWSETRSIEMK